MSDRFTIETCSKLEYVSMASQRRLPPNITNFSLAHSRETTVSECPSLGGDVQAIE